MSFAERNFVQNFTRTKQVIAASIRTNRVRSVSSLFPFAQYQAENRSHGSEVTA
jgi:hypothetical protein